jgi:hypothetical protein
MKVYLCGPINGRSDAGCKDWRIETPKGPRHRLQAVIMPLIPGFDGRILYDVPAAVDSVPDNIR